VAVETIQVLKMLFTCKNENRRFNIHRDSEKNSAIHIVSSEAITQLAELLACYATERGSHQSGIRTHCTFQHNIQGVS